MRARVEKRSVLGWNKSIASEVKVTGMSFKDTYSSVPTMEDVAVRPQLNNESNSFVKDTESAASAASVKAGGRFSNFTVDGVSCESAHVWFTICKFFSSECNHLGSTDPNHNGKSWRYQIIASGGYNSVFLGSYMLYTYVFCLSKISTGIFQTNYVASDRLLLE